MITKLSIALTKALLKRNIVSADDSIGALISIDMFLWLYCFKKIKV